MGRIENGNGGNGMGGEDKGEEYSSSYAMHNASRRTHL